ncbi:MAG: response regulator transcription factor [Clostridia bacterium]|nr:response regulator transcription factor [Clostridia bacterium]
MQNSEITILIADDDAEIAAAVSKLLAREGYRVLVAANGLEALEAVSEQSVQLIILDVMMPKLDGLSATMRLREKNNIPIIILSAKTEDSDKVLGLTMGADDYVTKPFHPQELVARVNSQLRRYLKLGNLGDAAQSGRIVNGRLCLDTQAKEVLVDGESVRLTPIEYKILDLLMSNPGVVFSAEKIYERVWNEPSYSVENTVMVHIRRIREKIEINPSEPEYLKVVWGIGYKMEKHGAQRRY